MQGHMAVLRTIMAVEGMASADNVWDRWIEGSACFEYQVFDKAHRIRHQVTVLIGSTDVDTQKQRISFVLRSRSSSLAGR